MNQYTATPAGAQRNMPVNTMGMNIIIFCWVGSAPAAGASFCCHTIVMPMSTGMM
jgi:hypothetical protein